jgi:hypothetical protein
MKKLAVTGFIAALCLGSPVTYPQESTDEHAGHHPPSATTSAGAPAKDTATQGMDPAATPRMQDNMKTMQNLMTRFRSSKDPAERQQLLQQHSKAMQDQMRMMRGMSMGAVQDRPTKAGGMMNRDMIDHEAMQVRMNMMQVMMEQILQHQEAQQDQKPVK